MKGADEALFSVAEPQTYQYCCPICTDDYLTIARQCISDFGIVQCNTGHDLCQPCWAKLHNYKCPTCRLDMSEPVHVRVLENDVKEHPAVCRWPGCLQVGLTLGMKTEHEETCSQKLLPCVCGKFSGIHTSLEEHQKSCIKHHLSPLAQQVVQLQQENRVMQGTIKGLRHKIQVLESQVDIVEGQADFLMLSHDQQGSDIAAMQSARRTSSK